jgi:hypothetical protein
MSVRKLGLVFIAIIIFFAALLLILSLTLYQFLYPSIYINTLEDSGAFEFLESQMMNGTNFIKTDERGIEPVFHEVLGNLLSYIRSDTNVLNLTVQIDKEALREFFLESVRNVTICAPNQTYSLDDLENICRPADKDMDLFLDEILESQNVTFLEGDTINLADIYGLEQGSDGQAALEKIRQYVLFFKIVVVALALFISLLAFFTLRLSKGTKGFMRWSGIPLLLAGLIVVLAVLIGNFVLNDYLAGMEVGEVPIFPDIIRSFADNVSFRIYLMSSMIGIMGLVLFTSSFLMPQNPGEKMDKKSSKVLNKSSSKIKNAENSPSPVVRQRSKRSR